MSHNEKSSVAPSRQGRKAISGYFSPQMSLAMHMCARKNDMSLQALMAEAFNDVLRKYGESPVGD
ncbi:ribbon-helix-helix domain-containing protein [Altericroceibacterium xinjiangense]|uniref:ribbon-helix-helix domain-containing protein n=1 Tax=Altericroceibacterium xinjiangense TaxID=762261 RepID=UPI001F49AD70|nr:ribbon-helix-helix domain-containing protein [Altericroceibacterium xinjiangense]